LGWSVSGAGDVNGDGIADLIIGAGPSYVIFGRAGDLPATINLATDADVVLLSKGGSVSGAGDVNGDGIDDLLVGAPYASPQGRREAGRSFVVYGTDRRWPAAIRLARQADLIIQGAGVRDQSGYSVSGAGDVNGDGFDDVLIGAPYADPNGRRRAGASYVIFGAADPRSGAGG
jgi:glycosylphosphatidylinositol phospholipase D